jgi:signal transduction histidine kinase
VPGQNDRMPIETRVDSPPAAVLVVEDDRQIAVHVARTLRGGAGLANIRERATALGGRLDVRRRAGGGTRVRLEVPIA